MCINNNCSNHPPRGNNTISAGQSRVKFYVYCIIKVPFSQKSQKTGAQD